MTSVWGRVAAGFPVLIVSILAVPAQGANLGYKIGLSVSDQFSNKVDGYSVYSSTDARREVTVGMFLGFPMGRWRLVPTMSYLQKGSYQQYVVPESATGIYHYAAVSSDLTYLSCQGDVHFTFPLGSAGFYILASPRVDLLLGDDRTVYDNSGGANASSLSVPAYHSVTVGGALGIGQDISVGDHVLFMEFRYDRDLTPFWEIPYPTWRYSLEPTMETASFYNRSFLFQLGIRLNAVPHKKQIKSTELWPAKQ